MLASLLARVPGAWTRLEAAAVDRLYSVVTPIVVRRNVRQFCVLYGDHTRLVKTERFEDLLADFESDLDLHIAANSQERLFIHAGAVRWKDHTLLIPGRSQTGKTTLVSEFLKNGAAFYSDDFAVVDRSGHLHAYPRDLTIRIASGARKVSPAYYGAAPARPAPVTTVLITEYSGDANWIPGSISRGEGLLRLLENTPSARKQPIFALEVLQNTIANAEVHRGYRGDKAQTVTRVLSYLDRGSIS